MDRLDYREIVKKLDAIDRRLCAMGLTQFDRIRVHRRNITELADASDAGTLDQITTAITEERRREILWSFVESIELVDAIDALDRHGCTIPREMFEKALQGPADLFLEDENSNRGRNTMFEIAIAGAAAKAGSKPEIGGEPDVLFTFNDRRIFIQCKRVISPSAIPKRVAEAEKQLKRDLAKSMDPRDCGVIAICLSRIINPGDAMLRVGREEDLPGALRREKERIVDQYRKVFRSVKSPKVAGILFYVGTPAYVDSETLFTVAHSSSLYQIPGKADEALRDFSRAIRF